MSEKTKTLRSELSIARGLGPAKKGVNQWAAERLAALILIPVSLYLICGFMHNVVDGGYSGAVLWLQSPISASFTLLFLFAGLYHKAGGLQVVIEDYIYAEGAKLFLLFIIKFACAFMALIGSLAIAKIYLGV